jgi:hypothetical protein
VALTQAQLTALAAKDSEGKIALKIDATSPLLYCSGDDPVQVAGEWYAPRNITGSFFELSDPSSARTKVAIDDLDEVVETAWYSDRFSGYSIEVHILLRTPPSQTWVLATSVTWDCHRATPRNGMVELHLFGAAGSRQKYGLIIGNVSLFPRAPSFGEKLVFNGTAASVTRPVHHYYSGPGGVEVEAPKPPAIRRSTGRRGV